MGIYGVILATAISVIISEVILKTKVVFDKVLKQKNINLMISNIKFIIIAVLDFIIGTIILGGLNYSNIFIWFGIFSLYFCINAIVILLIYYLFKSADFVKRIKIIFKKGDPA